MTDFSSNPHPYEEVHITEIFWGDWVAFATCSCGWRSTPKKYYYSKYSTHHPNDTKTIHHAAAREHVAEMQSFWWRLKRAIRGAWRETKEGWSKP